MSEDGLTVDDFREVLRRVGSPVVSTEEVAAVLDLERSGVDQGLRDLADEEVIGTRDPPGESGIWYPIEWEDSLSRERVILFPDRRELVADRPRQFTRAQISQFAHLMTASGRDSYLYRVRPVDIWNAPFPTFDDLRGTVRHVVSDPPETFMDWIREQWDRASQFRLETHPDGYTVLVAATPSLMANVARQELGEDQLRADISDTRSWVAEDSIAEIKRALYDAGFPVSDERSLETGDPLECSLEVELRTYQRDWIERFFEEGSGVLVGPPGSGKTVAALGVMQEIGGETLVLVPSRELAAQWRQRILTDTDLTPGQVGEYHGGEKQVRPVTIATYHTAGMNRHRHIFEDRRWGLLAFDECLAGETIIHVPDGPRTFESIADEHAVTEGWNRDVDLTVRTFCPERETHFYDDVRGIYTTVAPIERITTESGATLRATPDHRHLVIDPASGTVMEQRGISQDDYLLRPTPRSDSADEEAPIRPFETGARASTVHRPPGVRSRHSEYDGQLRIERVKRVEPAGVERVYDFETASHTFLADGFLTHNCQHIPAEVYRRTADLQSKYRLGLSASPVRGDDREDEIFTLIGPPIGTDWAALLDEGSVIEPELEIRYLPWGSDDARASYDAAEGHARREAAAATPAKIEDIRRLRNRHTDEPLLIFVDWIDQGDEIAAALEVPFVSGETRHAERERLFADFRDGNLDTLVVSRVGDEGIDLPDASVAILASGLGGSRRQGTQRVGRTMRPAGTAKVYVLATRGTREEDFALHQLRHLRTKGMRVRERTVELEES